MFKTFQNIRYYIVISYYDLNKENLTIRIIIEYTHEYQYW